MTPETLLAKVSGQSIPLAEPVGGANPIWSLVEFGWCASGLDEPYQAAFRFRHGRDPSVYVRLRRHLRREAERLAWREKWKRKIRGRQYVDYLVNLVLSEEWLSLLDRQRLLNHMLETWSEEVYVREIADKQRRIAMVLDRWNSIAHEHISRKIRANDEEIEGVGEDYVEALA